MPKNEHVEAVGLDTAYAVYKNTDMSEGRGAEYPASLCRSIITARRLAKGNYVEGSDCNVKPVRLLLYDGMVYGPVFVIGPTVDDLKVQAELDRKAELAAKKESVINKAKAAGLTDEELESLKS